MSTRPRSLTLLSEKAFDKVSEDNKTLSTDCESLKMKLDKRIEETDCWREKLRNTEKERNALREELQGLKIRVEAIDELEVERQVSTLSSSSRRLTQSTDACNL